MFGFRSSKSSIKNVGTKLDHMVNGTNLNASERFIGNPDFEPYESMSKTELAITIRDVLKDKDAISGLSIAKQITVFSKLDEILEFPNINPDRRSAFEQARSNLANSLSDVSFEKLKNQHPSTQMGYMEKLESLVEHSTTKSAPRKIAALEKQNALETLSRVKSKSIQQHIANNPALLSKIRILNQSRIFKEKGYSPAQPLNTTTKAPLDLKKLQPKIDRADRKIAKYEAEYDKFMKYMENEKLKIEKYDNMIKEVEKSKSKLKDSYNERKEEIFTPPEQTRKPSKSIFKSFGQDLSEGASAMGRPFKNLAKGLTAASKYKVAKDSLHADIQNETGIFNQAQRDKRAQKIEDLSQRLSSFRQKIDEKKTRNELLKEVQSEIRENVKKSRKREREYLNGPKTNETVEPFLFTKEIFSMKNLNEPITNKAVEPNKNKDPKKGVQPDM